MQSDIFISPRCHCVLCVLSRKSCSPMTMSFCSHLQLNCSNEKTNDLHDTTPLGNSFTQHLTGIRLSRHFHTFDEHSLPLASRTACTPNSSLASLASFYQFPSMSLFFFLACKCQISSRLGLGPLLFTIYSLSLGDISTPLALIIKYILMTPTCITQAQLSFLSSNDASVILLSLYQDILQTSQIKYVQK